MKHKMFVIILSIVFVGSQVLLAQDTNAQKTKEKKVEKVSKVKESGKAGLKCKAKDKVNCCKDKKCCDKCKGEKCDGKCCAKCAMSKKSGATKCANDSTAKCDKKEVKDIEKK